jgi:hypothetical protein
MIEEGKIRFRTFTLELKKRPLPNSLQVSFAGGTDVDSSGWETPSGDRKRFEGDFKFMWNPLDASSNKKGEYVVRFQTEERLKNFLAWLDKQIREYGGMTDR